MDKYTISDIARIAGVSKATVSRVINNNPQGVGMETRERIQKIITDLNYRPNNLARSVAVSRSNTIGLVIPDISNLFFPELVRGVDDYITSQGYTMMLCNTDHDPVKEQAQLLSFIDKRVDGVIMCSGVSNKQFLLDFKRYDTPLVLIGRIFDSHLSDASITGDNFGGAVCSAQFLVDNGNKKIAYLDGPSGVWGCIQRLSGYNKVMSDAGIEKNTELIHQGEFSIEFGTDTVNKMIRDGVAFDAVFAGSDLIAIGAVKALRAAKIKIPDEVEVMGFDDINLSKIYDPPISTVSKPHYEMAMEASKMLIALIEGTLGSIRHIVVGANLILRETTNNTNFIKM